MVIIDVRSQHEYDKGHVEGALLLDIEQLAAGKLPDLPKDTEITTYCRTGSRSELALHVLRYNGFTHVTNGGGLDDMVALGHKMT